MNVKLLRKVKRHILANPKRLWMKWFIARKTEATPMLHGRAFPECGTAACVAGWACILSGLKVDDYHIGMHAKTLLEVDMAAANRLFVPSEWPAQFRAGLADDGKKKTAQVAAARIEHFIKTKGAE